MTESSREARLNTAFVTLADTLTDEYDVVDLLHTLMNETIEVVDAQASGLMLANGHNELELVASTSERADFVEVMQLNAGSGPCVQCFGEGRAVSVADVSETGAAWTEFRAAALLQGFHSVHAVPLRLRSETIGAMNLFRTSTGVLSDRDAAVAQALADVATIGILQERIIRETAIVTEQLQRALDSRILIEQAKGVVAESAGVEMEEAFAMLRDHARSSNLTLRSIAEGVVGRTLEVRNLVRVSTSTPTP
ncbi:GAF and ANTAR domain-containing protein [Agromyces laixinhei]|uniref:GAF and ANTAR domain-containing protein n=1 Tax=Agromyces laixinhei TaxID=2585717 RepID=UPI0012EDE075|nr:GAF and ANTAR domain-containing protein [Agromyces laixinhei]